MSTLTRLIRATRSLLSCAAIVASASTLAQSQPTNASFESPAYGAVGRNALPTTATWTFAGTAGIERFSVNDTGTPNTGGVNGMQAAYLSSTGTVASLGKVSQDFNFPAAGQYQLRFMAGRVGAANAIRVSVGGVVVDSDITPRLGGGTTTRQLESWWTVPFSVAAAGNLTVSFSATNTAATLAVGDVMWVDQVTMLALPVALPNGSFETVGSGWTLASGATNTALTTPGVSGARGLVSSGTSGFNYFATSTTVTVPAGVYSLSLRIARTDPNTAACTTALSGTYTGAGTLALIPAPKETELTAYTTSSFSLPAGTYSLRLNGQCGGGAFSPVVYDGLVLNKAGPDFANTDFATPYVGAAGDPNTAPPWLPPWQTNPPGATWTFVDNAIGTGYGVGIQGNATSTVTVYPRTEFGGGQFGTVWSSNSGIRQSVSLASGVYAVAVRAAYGSFKLSVNGVNQSTFMHGGILQNQSANGYRFIEVNSEPFTVTTAGTVQLGFEGTRFSFQYPRIIRLSDVTPPNTPPVVALSLQVNGTAVTGPVSAGGTLVATATASDADGLQKIRILRNGVELAPNSTAVAPASAATPLNVTVSPLTVGSYTFNAEATDHLGAVSTASQALTVNPVATVTSGAFSPSPAIAGQSLTLTATVSPATAAGNVTFSEGATTYCANVPLTGTATKTATCNVLAASVTAGAHTYTLNYLGDSISSASTANQSVTVITNVAPTVSISTPAAATSIAYGTGLSITATANDTDSGVSSIQLKDGATNLGAACPFTATANTARTCTVSLPATATVGAHSITAIATDAAGATTTSASVVITVTAANIPPTASITTPATATSVAYGTGLSITATANDTDSGVSSIQLKDGATNLGAACPFTATANTARTCIVTLPATATVGTHSITAVATDAAGATTTSAAVVITVTNAPPTVSITTPATATSVTFGTAVSITATANDINDGVTSIQVKDGATNLGAACPFTATANTARTCTVSLPATAVVGAHSITAVATDAAGATTTSAAVVVTVNAVNVPPTVSMTTPATATSITFGTAYNITATANDTDNGVSSIQLKDGATNLGTLCSFTATANTARTCMVSLPATAVVGAHSITAVATDAAGATTTSAAVVITVTTVNAPPTVSITTPAAATSIAYGTGLSITATANDTDNGVTGIQLKDGATNLGAACPFTATANTARTCTVSLPATAVVGAHSITAVATDAAGATTTSAVVVITVTNALPTVGITTPAAATSVAYGTGQTIIVTGNDIDNGVSSIQVKDGATNLGSACTFNAAANTARTCAVALPPTAAVGTHSITAVATDAAGATTTSAAVVIIVVSGPQPPTVSITSPASATNVPYGTPYSISASANDVDDGVSTIQFKDGTNDLNIPVDFPASPNTVRTHTVTLPTDAPLGPHTITAIATDASGATTTSAAIVITVVPNLPPTVSVTTPSVATSTPFGTAYGIIATANDTDNGVSSIQIKDGLTSLGTACTFAATANTARTCTVPLPATAAVGAHSITAVATDASGVSTTSAAVVVTVTNATPTVSITTPATAASVTFGTAYSITATANDADNGVASIQLKDGATNLGAACPFSAAANTARTCTVTLPATATVGTHSITAVATDAAGASTSSAAVVITVTNALPTVSITTPATATTVAFGAGYTITAAANDTDNGVTSIQLFDGLATLGTAPCTFTATANTARTCTVSLPTGASVGAHSITAVATDAAGGSTTSAAVVISVITQVTSTTSLAMSPSPSTFGSNATLTATISPSSATGTVTFTDGITPICTNVAVSATAPRTATCTVPTGTGAGIHTFNANYSGDAGTLGSVSSASQTINKQAATVSITSSMTSPIAGQSFTLTATVSPATATGLVNFIEGGYNYCLNVPLSTNAPKTATCTVPAGLVFAAAHGYTAAYSGDSNSNAASATLPLSVQMNTMQCTLSIDPPQSVYFLGATIKLTPTCASGGNAIPAAQLNVKDWLANGVTMVGFGFTPDCNHSTCQLLLSENILNLYASSGQIQFAAAMEHNQLVYAASTGTLTITAEGNRISDGTFENYDVAHSSNSANGTNAIGFFALDSEATLMGPNWTFSGSAAVGHAGVQRDGSGFMSALLPGYPTGKHDGFQTAFLQNLGTAATLVNLSPGGYSLKFEMVNRSNWAPGGLQTVAVKLGATTIGTISPPLYDPQAAYFATYDVPFSVAAAGTYTITFAGTTNTGDNTALFDNVKLFRISGGSGIGAPSGCQITGPSSLAAGGLGNFLVSCTGGSAPTSYVWTRSSTPVGTNSASLNDTPFSNATSPAVTYAVMVSNAAGSATPTKLVTNSSNPNASAPSGCQVAPSVSGVYASTSTATPTSVTLTASCSSGTALSYTWKRNGTTVAGTAATLTDTPFSGISPASATYDVTISNAAGSVTASTSVSNLSAPSADKVSISGTSVTGGQVVVALRGSATTTAGYTISGTLTNVETGTPIGLTYGSNELRASTPPAGMYTVTVTATNGAETTTTRTTLAIQTDASADSVANVAILTPADTAVVGKVAGSFSVSEGGSAGYTIPIQVPPGTNGLQPALAFSYSSGSGYGTMGIGWSLSGLGAITHCPKTVAQDGYRAAVNYDNQESNDVFCLGGQRLVPVTDLVSAGNVTLTYNPSGNKGTVTQPAKKQVFRTEIESYSRITGYKEWPEITAGFSRFMVETKDGRVMHYSRRYKPLTNGSEGSIACSDSNNPLTCPGGDKANRIKMYILDRVEDSSGNLMDIEYHTTRPTDSAESTYVQDWDQVGTVSQGLTAQSLSVGGNNSYPPTEILPKVIKYSNGHSVEFSYDAHPVTGQMRTFDSGAGEAVITQRLIGVTTYADGTLAKRYALNYDDPSHTGRTRLHSVAECYGTDAATCLPATTFTWQGEAIATLAALDSTVGEGNYTFSGSRQLIGDIRGAGRSSVVLTDYSSSGVLATVVVSPGVNSTKLRVCELAGATSGVAGAFVCKDAYVQAPGLTNTEDNTYLADINGDGKADLIFGQPDTGNHYVCLAAADGSGFSSIASSPTPCQLNALGATVNNGLLQGDFNGDGRIDLLVYRNYSPADTAADGTLRHKFGLYLGQDTGNFKFAEHIYFPGSPKEQVAATLDQGELRKRFFVADYNGDGLADVMQKTPGANGAELNKWRVCYARGKKPASVADHDFGYFDCPRDTAIVVGGVGVSTPAPVIQMNTPYQCTIPIAQIPVGTSRSWTLSYGGPAVPIGVFGFSTSSSATVLNNGACTATNGVSYPAEGFNNTIYGSTTSTPATCANGINLSVTASDPNDTVNPLVQTISVSRSTAAFTGDVVISHAPLGGVPPIALTVPAGLGITCVQSKPTSVIGPSTSKPEDMVLADFNGDGLADLAVPVNSDTVKTDGNWQVCLSTGDGGFERWTAAGQRTSTCKTFSGLLFARGDAVVTGDFDGDGRTDLMGYQESSNGANGWQIAYARGSSSAYNAMADAVSFSLKTGLSTFVPWSGNNQDDKKISSAAHVGDFNGDGISDISIRVSSGGAVRLLSPTALNGATGAGAGARQEVITGITDGLGSLTEIVYAPLTDDSGLVYEKNPTVPNTALAAKEIDARSPMLVVKQVNADNGLSCTRGTTDCEWHTTTFKYYGMRGSTDGRGMLGFSQRDVTESFGSYIGAKTQTAYNNSLAEWWLAGSVKKAIKTLPAAAEPSKRLSEATMEYWPPRPTAGFAGPGATVPTIYEVFSKGSTQYAWDLDGTALPTQNTSTPSWDPAVAGASLGYDNDGNVLRTTATTTLGSDVHSKSSVNTYGYRSVTDTGASIARGEWVLGRLTKSVVTHSKTGTSDITRTSAFAYYGDGTSGCTAGTGDGTSSAPKGFVCDEIVEPDSANSGDQTLWSSTRHRYNSFGHRVNSTASYKAPLNLGDTAGSYTGVLTRNLGSTTFDAKGRFPESVANALLHSESRTFNHAFGVVTDLVGPNGLLTKSDYDAFGRKVRERSFAGSSASAQMLSDATTLTLWCTQTDPIAAYATAATACKPGESHRKRSRASGGSVTITFYDKLQREVRSVTQAYLTSAAATNASANTWVEATASYDARGRKYTTTKPAGDGTATTTLKFDDLERVKEETLVGTNGANITAITATTYSGLSTTVTRNKAATDPTDRGNQATTRLTDSQGKVTKITDAAVTDTTYTYDAVGNLLTVKSPGATTAYSESMTYDLRGRKTVLTSLQAGTSNYLYNGLGELVRQTDGRGWVNVQQYDVLGRVTQRDEREILYSGITSIPTVTTNWSYDSGSACGLRTTGKLCSVTTSKANYANADVINGPSSETRYVYDNAGRGERVESAINLSSTPVAGDISSGPKRFAASTYFDNNSRPAMVGAPGGVVFKNHYSAWGSSLWKVTDGPGSVVHWQAASRFNDGHIKSMTLPGGLTTTKALDGLGRIDTIVTGTTADVTSIQNANFDIDSFGNLVKRSDLPTGLSITPLETYQYDALNRVTGQGGSTIASYDGIGNLLSKAGGGAYTYDTGNTRRLNTYAGRTYSYDGNGNVIGDGLRTVVYTAWNLPWSAAKGATKLVWDYDHGHSRTIEKSPLHGTTFFGPGGYELVVPTESSAANPKAVERTYIPTPEGVIGILTRTTIGNPSTTETISNKSEYWHKDHLGSIVAITDATGAVTQRFRFDPWGARTCLSPAGGTISCSQAGSGGSEERGFTGHEMLDEIGLVHMNGRLYDQELGRFVQADPVIQEALNGQNYNRYAYVQNNPLSYTDPTGFSWWTKWRRPILGLVAAIAVPWAVGELFLANASATGTFATTMEIEMYASASLTQTGSAVANIAGGMAAGGIQGGTVQSALIGAVTAGAQFGVGEALGHGTPSMFGASANAGLAAQKMLAHAAIGCASAAASGGSCKAGAAAAGFSSLAGGSLPGANNLLGRAAIGAIASKLAGGKAEQGALLAAMEYLYNDRGDVAGAERKGHCSVRECTALDKVGAFVDGMWSVVTGTSNAGRFIARGAGWMGRDELVKFNEEGHAMDQFINEYRTNKEFAAKIDKEFREKGGKFLAENMDGGLKSYIAGRAMTGAITAFGPAAMIGDFTHAIESGHGVVDALGFGGLLGKLPKR